MSRATHRFSLFPQGLDRVAFTAYFLGGVVPLAALAWVTQRYVLPQFRAPWVDYGLLGLIASIALLSLGSFFSLRRATRNALARVADDNRRLAALLEASRSLASAPDTDEVMRLATDCALALGAGRGALFLTATDKGDLRIAARAGTVDDLAESHDRGLRQALRAATERGEPLALALHPDAPTDGRVQPSHPAIALPCGDGAGPRAILVVHADRTPRSQAERSTLSTLARLTQVALDNADLRDAQRNFFTHVTSLLVSALDAYLSHQTDHSRRVAQLANRVAREIGLSEERLHRLHFAALLHDIGMLRLDRDQIFTDREAIRRHPEIGYEMLRPIRLWEEVAPLVRSHHEWYDGGGYPDGLAAEAIPLESRIIAVVEAFDSMTAATSYQEAVPVEVALSRIRAAAGGQFDPEIARAFLDLARRGQLERGP